MSTSLLEMNHIKKEFDGLQVLKDVSIHVNEGEVVSIIGSSGSGKSTLLRCATLLTLIDDGEISYMGKKTVWTENGKVCLPNRAQLKEIQSCFGLVFQNFNLFPHYTVMKNITDAPIHVQKRNKDEVYEEARELLAKMGLSDKENAYPYQLSGGQCQRVAIARALALNPKILFFDEPTSALTSKESEILFSKVNELKQKGIAFIFISHRLEEVFELCDSYTVLRDGKWIASGDIKDVDTDKLIAMMVGRDIKDIYPPIPQIGKDIRLEVKNLGRKDVFQKVSFQVHKGEIFGLAGMVGAGRSEIVETLFGLARANEGEIILDGKPIKIRSVKDAIQNGIAMVTEDRRTYGFVGVRSISDNIILPNGDLFAKGGIWDKKKVQQEVAKICKRLSVKAPDANTLVGNLSGGNQQKVVLAKWLVRNIKLLILDEPTRGIDVGAKQEIYSLITEFAEQGLAIILISSDMPEVLSMSHRVGVVGGGKMLGILDRNEISQNKIMKMIVEAKGDE